VHRGAERELHELAGQLIRRGQDVRVLTGTPRGLMQTGVVEGAPVRYVRAPRRKGWPDPGPGFAAAALAASLRYRPDVVHCLHYADAAGAARGRAPVILKLTGTVLPDRMQGLDARLLASALERSAEVWANSTWAVEQMKDFDVPMRVVPAGLDTSRFAPGPRSGRPLVVCAATGNDPRKRVVDLLAAWPAVRDQLPDAELVVTATGFDLPAGARSIGPQTHEQLAQLYASAWTVVAPAVYEALGLVTLEALASGTPVAGADSGATSELLADPRVGTLAEPTNPESLADAIVRAAHLSQDPATADHCRARSLPFDWSQVVPTVLEGYERVRLSHSRVNRR
jgi:glycosyltransferase involved in cell wall biosynthesis